MAANDVANLPSGNDMPKALTRLVGQVIDAGGAGNSSRFLMHEGIASKLVDRLVNGGILTTEQRTAFMGVFVEAPDPFFDKAESKKSAGQIESGILNRLHLHKMPTDEQVGLSTVFHLADDIVSGETIPPLGRSEV